MKIVVLGAGLIGVTTAYLLNKQGHDITIIDRENGPGTKCSYSNGAQLSYCHAEPWSTYNTFLKALRWIGKKDKPLLWKPSLDPDMWKWILKFLTYCNSKSADLGTEKILKLGLYSRKVLHEFETDFDFNFDYEKGGKIFTFTTEEELNCYLRQARLQEIHGSEYHILNKDEVLEYEPCLKATIHKYAGFVRDTLDESADAYKYCVGIDSLLEKNGVNRLYNTEIKKFNIKSNNIESIETKDWKKLEADLYILCFGAYSKHLENQLKLKLPLYPLKGYSITVDIENPEDAPRNSITDTYSKTVFSRVGNRLRAAGTAEFAGFNEDVSKHRIKMMKDLVSSNFPNIDIDENNISSYACLRPSTPDGVPVLGECKYNNMLLNTGHGTLGWTQTFASAQMISDIVEEKETELPLEWYSIDRF